MRLSKAVRRFLPAALAALLWFGVLPLPATALTAEQLFEKIIPRVQPNGTKKPATGQRKPKPVAPAPVIAVPGMPTPRSKPAGEEPTVEAKAVTAAPVKPDELAAAPSEPSPDPTALAATARPVGTLSKSLSAEELAFAAPISASPLLPEPVPPLDPARSSLGIVLTPDGSLPPPPGIDHVPGDPVPEEEIETEAHGDGTPLPRSKPGVILAAIIPPRVPLVPEALTACRSAMTALQIAAKPMPAEQDGTCGAPDPFEVSALQDGTVALQPAATINCETASMLSTWVSQDVQSAALSAYGSRVTAVRVMDSYSCRGRNNVVGAPLSEHAFMNAIDVGAFKIGDRWVTVEKDKDHTDKDTDFIETVRQEACSRFMTVLGPGSDGYHENHLHLDMRHRGQHGDSRYCH
jgi:hypothetical protein